MQAEVQVDRARLLALVGAIPDPEIPVVTLADLGIVRDVLLTEQGPRVVLTPTYSGCPATEAIAGQVRDTLREAGCADAAVDIQLAPAWTTDWISDDGRRKLRAYGIAPPGRCGDAGLDATIGVGAGGAGPSANAAAVVRPIRLLPKPAVDSPACPRCDSPNVELLSQHGSTPCKALYRCRSCREPFDYFKPY